MKSQPVQYSSVHYSEKPILWWKKRYEAEFGVGPEKERLSYVAGRVVLAHFLGRIGEKTQVRVDSEWGYLILESGRGYVSLAHTERTVYVAFALRPIGIDVEPEARNAEKALQRIASPRELEIAQAADNPQQFALKVWCSKEALSKAIGTGLRGQFSKFEVDWDRGITPFYPAAILIEGPMELAHPAVWFDSRDQECVAIASEKSLLTQAPQYLDLGL